MISGTFIGERWMKQEGKAKLKKSIKVNEMVCAAVHSNEPTHFEIITHDPKRSIVLRHTDRGRWIIIKHAQRRKIKLLRLEQKRHQYDIISFKQGCNRRVMITGFDDNTLKHTIQDHGILARKKSEVEETEIDTTHKVEEEIDLQNDVNIKRRF